ncbi:MAG TPA: phospho-sugar mutase [Planctomycetota bacterium]|nr:phospho-sugar mutase [Planctomycetota bacterium]
MKAVQENDSVLAEVEDAQKRGRLSSEALGNLRKWLTEPQYAGFRDEIARLVKAGNWPELNDSFYKIIPFGTGGRRGPCGVGPNRMNVRTVGESTQGLSRYIAKFGQEAAKRGVVVAYDVRHHSREFAEQTARVLAGNGVKAYLFDDFRPTPELSFAVRYLNAQAGVVISASHNPPSDNGYKVFWEDGAQIVSPEDAEIIAEVQKVADLQEMPLSDAKAAGLFEEIGAEIDRAFIEAVCRMALTANRDVKIVYSPLHGTGIKTVVPVLAEAGFKDVTVVAEQATPDPDFSNVPDRKPNPEEPHALDVLIEQAGSLDADIALATDPDADRAACAVKERLPGGEMHWVKLTGNQVACLICHFTLSQMRRQNRLPEHGVVVRTIVTTEQLDRIAADFGVESVNHLLVGFKYIGETIRKLPPGHEFIFGAEESLGYLRGTYCRDKDSAVAALTLCEMAATLKKQNRMPMDYLNDIYRTYGYYSEMLHDLYLYGQEGSEQMKRIMATLRNEPPQSVDGRKVERVVDRLTLQERIVATGETRGGVPGIKGDLMLLHLEGGARVAVRPSGTEPKAKFYVTVRRDVPPEISDNDLFELKRKTDAEAWNLIVAIERTVKSIAGVA